MSDTATDWLPALDAVFADTLARLPDEAFTATTALPGWTRAHIVAHVHFNALALCRLVGWASTGVEAAMYDSAEQRSDEIERGATESPDRLRELAAASAARFIREFNALTDDQLEAIVVTAQGRHVPARELAWLRCRELGVHAVDLDAGTTFDELPTGFVSTLVLEITHKRLTSGEGPALAGWLTGRAIDPIQRWL